MLWLCDLDKGIKETSFFERKMVGIGMSVSIGVSKFLDIMSQAAVREFGKLGHLKMQFETAFQSQR